MAGLIWLWHQQNKNPVPVGQTYSSMGRKRKQARLARLRKDDEIVIATIKAFLETRA